MGNPYVTGYFQSTIDFDTGEEGEDIYAAKAGEDAFLCKYDPDGNYLWTRTWGGILDDTGRAVAVDVSGNAYVTGIFSYTVDFHPGEGTEIHSSFGPDNAFLVKFDPEGNW